MKMEYRVSEYPLFSTCGLNCGLCPRYYTDGDSRCPGCAGVGFSEVHPPCAKLSCSQNKGVEYCFLCKNFPCKKYDGVDTSDSFISHKNQFRDIEKAKEIGLEAYKAELNAKVLLLQELLDSYDDGRRKSFYCNAVNLFELSDINLLMAQIRSETQDLGAVKEKAKVAVGLIQSHADETGISLKLRK